jgi:hypothetical protein
MRSLDVFNWANNSSRTTALRSTQPLTKMSTSNLSGHYLAYCTSAGLRRVWSRWWNENWQGKHTCSEETCIRVLFTFWSAKLSCCRLTHSRKLRNCWQKSRVGYPRQVQGINSHAISTRPHPNCTAATAVGVNYRYTFSHTRDLLRLCLNLPVTSEDSEATPASMPQRSVSVGVPGSCCTVQKWSTVSINKHIKWWYFNAQAFGDISLVFLSPV